MVRENSPSKLAATDQPLCQAICAPRMTSAALAKGCAPFTVKVAPGSVWNVAVALRLVFQSCAQGVLRKETRQGALSVRIESEPENRTRSHHR